MCWNVVRVHDHLYCNDIANYYVTLSTQKAELRAECSFTKVTIFVSAEYSVCQVWNLNFEGTNLTSSLLIMIIAIHEINRQFVLSKCDRCNDSWCTGRSGATKFKRANRSALDEFPVTFVFWSYSLLVHPKLLRNRLRQGLKRYQKRAAIRLRSSVRSSQTLHMSLRKSVAK